MICALLDLRSWCKDVSQENPGTLLSEVSEHSENLTVRPRKYIKAGSQEKSLSSSIIRTVPQTDTGVLLEKSKANE